MKKNFTTNYTDENAHKSRGGLHIGRALNERMK